MSTPAVTQNQDARGVVHLHLNRPDAFNALSREVMNELQQHLDTLAQSDTARVVVISAAGKAFCAGHDLREMRATPSQAFYEDLSRKAAFEMLVTGNFISADEALAKGLVNAVCAPQELESTVGRYVDSILHKPRVALAMGKQLFYRQLEQGIEAAYQSAGQTMACNMMDDAALEGVQAFIDKRTPSWRAA